MSPSAVSAVVAIVLVGFITALAVLVMKRRSTTVTVDRAQLIQRRAEWRTPLEIESRPVPRPVRLTGQGIMLFALPIIVFAAAGVAAAFGVGLLRNVLRDAALVEREGVAGEARIVNKWIVSGKSRSRHVSYSYGVGSESFTGEAIVSSSLYDRLTTGSTVPIRYAVSRPAASRMDGVSYPSPWLMLTPFVPLLLLIMLPTMAFRQRSLLANGTPTFGIVTAVWPTRGVRGFRYAYLDANGDAAAGSGNSRPRQAPAAGDQITVLFDPERPQRSGRYPLPYVRIDESAL